MSGNPIHKLIDVDAKEHPLSVLQIALDAILYRGTQPIGFKYDGLILHTAASTGNLLEGVVIPFDKIRTLKEARSYSSGAFAYKRSGWFIRLKNLPSLDNSLLTDKQIEIKESLQNDSNTLSNSLESIANGDGREQSPAATDGRSTVTELAGHAGDTNGSGGDQRDSAAGLSDDNVTSGRAGRNKRISSSTGRRIASADFKATERKRSGFANESGSSTGSARDDAVIRSIEAARAKLEGKAKLQADAEGTASDWGNFDNIQAALPYLMVEQQDDILKAEKRLIEQNQNGILFTNGTGTGKTFTGLGAVKRFANAGKGNVLIVSMNEKIVRDFIKSAKSLLIDVYQLQDTRDNGGEDHNIVATTYANFGQNKALAQKDWDLIIVDEAHNLMQNKDGDETGALHKLRALSGHHAGFYTWYGDRYPEPETIKKIEPVLDDKGNQLIIDGMPQTKEFDTYKYVDAEAGETWADNRQKQHDIWRKRWNEQPEGRTKVIFLSATPWSYVPTLDWAEGYLFHFTEPSDKWKKEEYGTAYNSGDDRSKFYMRNFGYTMRYNKLTRPNSKVNAGVNEREFANKIKESGAVSGRDLVVPFDYDRKFILVDSGVGRLIDKGMSVLLSTKDAEDRYMYPAVYAVFREHFDSRKREQLLEVIKAKAVISHIRKSIEMGRKVIIFHDSLKGEGFNPFNFDGYTFKDDPFSPKGSLSGPQQYQHFKDNYPELVNLTFDHGTVIETIKTAFPDALLFNGKVSAKQRATNADLFNADNNGHNLIIVQSDAGATGISFHDTTGVHQRVIFNLGLPKKPSKLRQTEGRIYRVGQASNAIHRYLTTGTDFETAMFAQVIAERAETVDNLAKGDDAVSSIRDALIHAYNEADANEPSVNDGIGGKQFDEENARIAQLSPFEKAKTFYYNKGKDRNSRQNKIGKDWYATPEPLGLKMVEWCGVHKGDDVLEPSAGDGAIGRWITEDANITMIEPSMELASRAQLANTSARVDTGKFEDHNTMIKYDAIVMNPPFGHAGSTALLHVKKACKHLSAGGRIVALVPNSAKMEEQLYIWMESKEGEKFHVIAKINLPSSTFANANTSVNTFIWIIERHDKPETVPQMRSLDFSSTESLDDLFNQIEHVNFAPRPLREDEALLEYGLILTPFKSNYLINGVGVGVESIRKALLSSYYITEVANDPNSLMLKQYFKPAVLMLLKNKEVEKIMPHKYDAFDGWQHDGFFDHIPLNQVKIDLLRYVRREMMANEKMPIIVHDDGKHYKLLIGYERYKLAKKKNESLVPAIVIGKEYRVTAETLKKAYQKYTGEINPKDFGHTIFSVLDSEAIDLLV